MEAAMKIIGMAGYVFLCICAAGFAVSLAFHCCEKAFEKLIETIRESERVRIANRLSSDSWWFSEDNRTMLLLQEYAKNRINGSRSINETRNEWRKNINK